MRRFAGIEFNEDAIPDESTILQFRRVLEKNDLAPNLHAAVNAHLGAKGLFLGQGTIIDTKIVAAPSSTKFRPANRWTREIVAWDVSSPNSSSIGGACSRCDGRVDVSPGCIDGRPSAAPNGVSCENAITLHPAPCGSRPLLVGGGSKRPMTYTR